MVAQDRLEQARDERVSFCFIETTKGRKRVGFVVLNGTAGLKQHINPLATFLIRRVAAESLTHKTLGIVQHAEGTVVIHSLAFLFGRFTPAIRLTGRAKNFRSVCSQV